MITDRQDHARYGVLLTLNALLPPLLGHLYIRVACNGRIVDEAANT